MPLALLFQTFLLNFLSLFSGIMSVLGFVLVTLFISDVSIVSHVFHNPLLMCFSDSTFSLSCNNAVQSQLNIYTMLNLLYTAVMCSLFNTVHFNCYYDEL